MIVEPGAIGPSQEGSGDKAFLTERANLKVDPFKYGFTTSFANSWNLTTGSMNYGAAAVNAFSQKNLSAEEAMNKYGISAPPEGISEDYAKFKYDKQQARASEEAILSSLDTNKFGASLYPLMGGLSKGILDPVGLATGMALGNVARMAAIRFGSGGLLSKTIISAYESSSSLAQAVKGGAIEGALESIISTPMMMRDERQTFDRDWTAEDALADVAGNIIGGAGLSSLGYGFKKMLGKYSSSQRDVLSETALSMALEGKKPDVRELTTAFSKDVYRLRPGQDAKIHSEFVIGNLNEAEFFASFSNKYPTVTDLDSNNVIDFSYGRGLILTDNPNFARNAAAKAMTGEEGSVLKVKLTDLNILDTKLPADSNTSMAIKSVLSKYLNKSEMEDILGKPTKRTQAGATTEVEIYSAFETKSLKEILDDVDRYQITEERDIDFQNEINDEIAKLGYSGYKFEGGNKAIGDSSKHNSIFLFDPRKTQLLGEPQKVKLLPDEMNSPELGYHARRFLEQNRSDAIEMGYDRDLYLEMEGVPTTPINAEAIELGFDSIWLGSDLDGISTIDGVPEIPIPPVIRQEIDDLPDIPNLKETVTGDTASMVKEVSRLKNLSSMSEQVFKAAEVCTRINS